MLRVGRAGVDPAARLALVLLEHLTGVLGRHRIDVVGDPGEELGRLCVPGGDRGEAAAVRHGLCSDVQAQARLAGLLVVPVTREAPPCEQRPDFEREVQASSAPRSEAPAPRSSARRRAGRHPPHGSGTRRAFEARLDDAPSRARSARWSCSCGQTGRRRRRDHARRSIPDRAVRALGAGLAAASARSGHVAIDRDRVVDHAIETEAIDHARMARRAETRSKLGIPGELDHRGRHRGRIVRRDETAGLTVDDHLGDGGDVRGQHRPGGRHGLQEDQAQPFPARGHHEDAGRGHERRDVPPDPGEDHAPPRAAGGPPPRRAGGRRRRDRPRRAGASRADRPRGPPRRREAGSVGLLRGEPRATQTKTTSSGAKPNSARTAARSTERADLAEGRRVEAVVDPRLTAPGDAAVLLDEAAHVIGQDDGPRRHPSDHAVDPAHESTSQDLLVVVLPADEGDAALRSGERRPPSGRPPSGGASGRGRTRRDPGGA